MSHTSISKDTKVTVEPDLDTNAEPAAEATADLAAKATADPAAEAIADLAAKATAEATTEATAEATAPKPQTEQDITAADSKSIGGVSTTSVVSDGMTEEQQQKLIELLEASERGEVAPIEEKMEESPKKVKRKGKSKVSKKSDLAAKGTKAKENKKTTGSKTKIGKNVKVPDVKEVAPEAETETEKTEESGAELAKGNMIDKKEPLEGVKAVIVEKDKEDSSEAASESKKAKRLVKAEAKIKKQQDDSEKKIKKTEKPTPSEKIKKYKTKKVRSVSKETSKSKLSTSSVSLASSSSSSGKISTDKRVQFKGQKQKGKPKTKSVVLPEEEEIKKRMWHTRQTPTQPMPVKVPSEESSESEDEMDVGASDEYEFEEDAEELEEALTLEDLDFRQIHLSSISLPTQGSLIFADIEEDDTDVSSEEADTASLKVDLSLPSLTKITLDAEVEDLEAKLEKSASLMTFSEGTLDMGRFVDPLTGQRTSAAERQERVRKHKAEQLEKQKEKQAEAALERKRRQEEEEIDDACEVDFSEDPDLLLPLAVDKELEQLEKPLRKETSQSWLEDVLKQDLSQFVVFDERDDEERQEADELLKFTLTFVDNLIKNAVTMSETAGPDAFLRKNLDKLKLMNELKEKMWLLDIERHVQTFLNRQTVLHFRRKRSYRNITEDAPATMPEIMERYQLLLEELDLALGCEEETNEKIEAETEELDKNTMEARELYDTVLQELNELITSTFQREGFEHLKSTVELQLRRMHKLRQEISSTRYVFIQRLHKLATLREKAKQLEDLGEGFKMLDYERLQTETQTLNKKLHERSIEVNELRTKCNAQLHAMAHLRDKKKFLRNTIKVEEKLLQELNVDKVQLRQKVVNLKVQRGEIRNQIRKLSHKAGLVDKPNLMRDYDDSMEQVMQKIANIEKMKEKLDNIYKRIEEMELEIELDQTTDTNLRHSLASTISLR